MFRSRLTRKQEQKTKKNLALSVLGIILILFLGFKFGIPMLINISSFFSGSKNDVNTAINTQEFIAPPVLSSNITATSSANISIEGIASKNQTIIPYINNKRFESIKTKDDGNFAIKTYLKPGENTIKAKVAIDEKESEFSNIITIILKSAPPSLNINSPQDNQSFSKDQETIEVKGTTDPDVKVTVNGFWAITDDEGNFTYDLKLKGGENKIEIIAEDVAGNKTTKEIKVNYSS
jgi:hypothetical protein